MSAALDHVDRLIAAENERHEQALFGLQHLRAELVLDDPDLARHAIVDLITHAGIAAEKGITKAAAAKRVQRLKRRGHAVPTTTIGGQVHMRREALAPILSSSDRPVSVRRHG